MPSDALTKSKIMKYLVDPLEIRFGKISPEPKREAFIQDAVADLGRFASDVIADAFTAVRRNHGDNWKPTLKAFVDAAQRIQAERNVNHDGQGDGRLGQINAQAAKYAGLFPWDNPQGKRIHAAGVPVKEIRDWVKPVAVRQLGQGWPEPDVTIPEDVVDAMIAKWEGKLSSAGTGDHFRKAVGVA